MGNVAVAMKKQGHHITGSDKNVYPPISHMLEAEGIQFTEEFAENNLDVDADLVVIGNAISRGNPEAEKCLREKMNYTSLPALLHHHFLKDTTNVVVTGTHGKSTITSFVTWLWKSAGKDPSYLIGGLSKDLTASCNLVGFSDFIIEGDEYDTAFFDKRSKFFHYKPNILIINNIELDHIDIFLGLEDLKRNFRNLINIIPPNGVVLANFDDENVREVVTQHPVIKNGLCKCISYGKGDGVDWRISSYHYEDEKLHFSLEYKEKESFVFKTNLVGEFNVYNLTAGIVSGFCEGFDESVIALAVESYNGMHRRMEMKGEVNRALLFDDFAHHPTAIGKSIAGIKEKYPDRSLWAIVEPRSNSMRRKIFAKQLIDALALADNVIMAKVDTPGKVTEADRLQPQAVIDALYGLGNNALCIPEIDDIVTHIKSNVQPGDIILGMSNGGFGNIYDKLLS